MSTSHHHDHHEEQQSELIPGLPTDISTRILTQIPPHHHPRLRSTSRIWRSFFSPSSILPLRHHLLPHHLHHLLLLFPRDPSLSSPILLHLPRHRHHHLAFTHLPHLPCSPHFYALSNFLPLSLPLHRLLLLGGSRFDNRSFPPDLPVPSPDVHSFDFASSAWSPLPPMLTPRGGFACGVGAGGVVIVAGGGSRHGLFGAGGGSRIGSVEVLDLGGRGGWEERARMPRPRAGCVGFFVGEGEFWVMGGYGDYRAVGGVLPVDVHCRDAVVYDLERDEWREVGDMWQEGERERLGAVAVVEGEGGARVPGVYMLDRNDIFRYDFASNRWHKETSLRRRIPEGQSCGFVAVDGELHVLTSAHKVDITDSLRPTQKRVTITIQIYHPKKRKWRFLSVLLPFDQPLDFKTTVLSTIWL